jgi:hypothetical protein
MDNQHRQIKGYRDLSEDEIADINDVKALEAQMLRLVTAVAHRIAQQRRAALLAETATETLRLAAAEPERWLAIAKTHIQEGASALVRAVAQPG